MERSNPPRRWLSVLVRTPLSPEVRVRFKERIRVRALSVHRRAIQTEWRGDAVKTLSLKQMQGKSDTPSNTNNFRTLNHSANVRNFAFGICVPRACACQCFTQLHSFSLFLPFLHRTAPCQTIIKSRIREPITRMPRPRHLPGHHSWRCACHSSLPPSQAGQMSMSCMSYT